MTSTFNKIFVLLFLLCQPMVFLAQSYAEWSLQFPELIETTSMEVSEWGADTLVLLSLARPDFGTEELSVLRLDGADGVLIDSVLIEFAWPYNDLSIEAVHFTDSLIFILTNDAYDPTGLSCLRKDLSTKWQVSTSLPTHGDTKFGAMEVDSGAARIYVIGYNYFNLAFDVYDFDGNNLLSDSLENPEAFNLVGTCLVNDTLYVALQNPSGLWEGNSIIIRSFDLEGNQIREWVHESQEEMMRVENFRTDGDLLWIDAMEYDTGPGTNFFYWSSAVNTSGDTINDARVDFFDSFSNDDRFVDSRLTDFGNVSLYYSDSAGVESFHAVKLTETSIDTLTYVGVADRFAQMAYNSSTGLCAIFDAGESKMKSLFMDADLFDVIDTSSTTGLFQTQLFPIACAPYQDGFILFASTGFDQPPTLSLIRKGVLSAAETTASPGQFELFPNPVGEADKLFLRAGRLNTPGIDWVRFYDLNAVLLSETSLVESTEGTYELAIPSTLQSGQVFFLVISWENSQQSFLLYK